MHSIELKCHPFQRNLHEKTVARKIIKFQSKSSGKNKFKFLDLGILNVRYIIIKRFLRVQDAARFQRAREYMRDLVLSIKSFSVHKPVRSTYRSKAIEYSLALVSNTHWNQPQMRAMRWLGVNRHLSARLQT